MIIGVLKEKEDKRVSLVPQDAKSLMDKGFDVWVEEDAGINAGFGNHDYSSVGVQIKKREDIIKSDIILAINRFEEIGHVKDGSYVIGLYNPFDVEFIRNLVTKSVNYIALELIPRISRAQSMDVLSSMATVAGYKAVLLAADYSIKMFPLLMTAGGTITPAKVLVVGAGVAGLQAIATAKRLGANVWGFDPRPATKEQIKSVGGNYIEFQLEEFEDKSGYAKEVDEQIIQKEREILYPFVVESDVIITTAAVPGKKAPLLITAEMVSQMKIGTVIVDLAASSGGNCQLTQKDKVIFTNNKTIIGYTNFPGLVPLDSSKLYSRNVYNLLSHISKGSNEIKPDFDDEIDRNVIPIFNKQVVNNRIKEMLDKWT
ncbi:MAG: NAD(P) transhydrogenase subunit alpha [bacterium]|nr:NAD(P) transhydrogenase subunit alpha [bacterium]